MANLATVTNIQPGLVLNSNLGTSMTTLLNGPNSNTKVIKITSIIVANVDGTNDADVSVYLTKYPTYNSAIAKTVTVPADSTLVVLSKDNPIYLNYDPNASYLSAQASQVNDLTVTVTYEEITCASA